MNVMTDLWYFLIYSVLGWAVEVAYHALTQGRVVNRGFLNGPVCPVYGFGMMAILKVFGSLEADTAAHGPLILFLGGMFITTLIELFAGWILDTLFHARWWDYSKEPFNFHGYICPKFSVAWGLGTVLVYKIGHTTVTAFVRAVLPLTAGKIFLAACYGVFLLDLCVTVATVRGLNKNLEELDELRKRLRIVSDRISEQIGEGTIRAAQHIEQQQVQAALGRAELRDQAEELKTRRAELSKRYEEARARLYRHPVFGPGRLAKAFPGAVHRHHDALLKEFREKLDH